MRKMLIALLFLSSANAFAATWELINTEYSPGNGYICTYQLQGTSYMQTILMKTVCPMFVHN